MTETTRTAPPHPQNTVCPVCSNIELDYIEAGLMLGHGPRKLSRAFKSLSRRQIAHHRDVCMGGNPRAALMQRKGWLDPLASEQEAAL